MPSLFVGINAASTLEEFLRAFHHGSVPSVACRGGGVQFLVQIAGRDPLLPRAGAVAFLDVDSLLRRVYGKQKQGPGVGHAKVAGYQLLLRGLNPLIRDVEDPGRCCRHRRDLELRTGNAGSARGASSLLTEASSRPWLCWPLSTASGELVVRADPALYRRKFTAAPVGRVRLSVTIAQVDKVKTTIATTARGSSRSWTTSGYRNPAVAVPAPDPTGCWPTRHPRCFDKRLLAAVRAVAR